MSKIKEVYLPFGGGLGDVFYEYFRGKHGWSYLDSLKNKYPNIKVKILSSTHNHQSLKFIKFHPHVDSMKELGWMTDARSLWEKHRGNAVRLEDAVKEKRLLGLSEKKQVLHLGSEDKQELKRITSAGKFVVVHPFAGGRDRIAIKTPDYIRLIDQIIEDLGYNVVVIGATHVRNNINNPVKVDEVFDYRRKKLFNLVNASNARVVMALIQKQTHFVGAGSAWACASWLHKKPNSILVPKQYEDGLRKRHRRGNRWHGTPKIHIHAVENNENKVIIDVLENIKNAK